MAHKLTQLMPNGKSTITATTTRVVAMICCTIIAAVAVAAAAQEPQLTFFPLYLNALNKPHTQTERGERGRGRERGREMENGDTITPYKQTVALEFIAS